MAIIFLFSEKIVTRNGSSQAERDREDAISLSWNN